MRPGTSDRPRRHRWTFMRLILFAVLLGCACSERASCLPRKGGTGDLRYPAARLPDPRHPFLKSTDDASARPMILAAEETGSTTSPAPDVHSIVPAIEAQDDGLAALLERLGARDPAALSVRARSEGLVLANAQSEDSFEAAYARLAGALNGSPASLLVTTDAVLHMYASWQRHLLRRAEVVQFVPLAGSLFEGLVKVSVGQARILPGSLSEAAWRNAIFLSVSARVVNPRFEIPSAIASEVSDLVEGIVAAEGRSASPVVAQPAGCADPCSGCGVCIDFSVFAVPPLYSSSADLRGVFRAVEWSRRIGFRMDGGSDTIQAILLADALKRLEITFDVDGKIPAMEVWRRIFRLEAYRSGDGGGPTVFDLDEALRNAFESGLLLSVFRNPNRRTRTALDQVIARLRTRFGANDMVLHLLAPAGRDAGVSLPSLVAPRVGPDRQSASFASLKGRCGGAMLAECEGITEDVTACICADPGDADPHGLCRRLPRAIDFAAASGSSLALDALKADQRWCGFSTEFEAFRYRLGIESSRTTIRMSGGAIASVLGSLWNREPPAPGTDLVARRLGEARNLTTCLGAVAHLGTADALLPAKPLALPVTLDVVVEPEPEFFQALSWWNGVVRNELAALHVLGTSELDVMRPLLLGTASAARRARDGQPLETWERDAVRILLEKLSPAALAEAAGDSSGRIATDVRSRRILATDPMSGASATLETGRTDWIVRLLPSPTGTLRPAIGPVHSTFERIASVRDPATLADKLPPRPALLQPLFPDTP